MVSNWFLILYVVVGILIFWASKTVGFGQSGVKEVFKIYVILGAFLIGIRINVSLFELYWSETYGAGSLSWRNLVNYGYLTLLSILFLFASKKLLKTESLGYGGTLIIAFGLGVITNSLISVIP